MKVQEEDNARDEYIETEVRRLKRTRGGESSKLIRKN